MIIDRDSLPLLYSSFSFNKPGLELDSQFRLFLSSKPDASFPLELLRLGLKVKQSINDFFLRISILHRLIHR